MGDDQPEQEVDEVIDEEDPNTKNQDFGLWLNWTNAHVSYLKCLLKITDKID